MPNSHPSVRNSTCYHQLIDSKEIIVCLGTASYRLLPEIIIKQPIYDADAEKFQKCFTPGVIEIENDDRGNLISE